MKIALLSPITITLVIAVALATVVGASVIHLRNERQLLEVDLLLDHAFNDPPPQGENDDER
jgi:hypothetical protein